LVVAATFAQVLHWPASQIAQMHTLGFKCKVTGFIVLVIGLILCWRPHRAAGIVGRGPVGGGFDDRAVG
jgi:hypothetical protein